MALDAANRILTLQEAVDAHRNALSEADRVSPVWDKLEKDYVANGCVATAEFEQGQKQFEAISDQCFETLYDIIDYVPANCEEINTKAQAILSSKIFEDLATSDTQISYEDGRSEGIFAAFLLSIAGMGKPDRPLKPEAASAFAPDRSLDELARVQAAAKKALEDHDETADPEGATEICRAFTVAEDALLGYVATDADQLKKKLELIAKQVDPAAMDSRALFMLAISTMAGLGVDGPGLWRWQRQYDRTAS